MAFIQTPGLAHRQPILIDGIQRNPEGVDRALKHAGVGQIELVTLRTQQFTCLLSLLAPLLGEVDIDPAGKTVFEIPLALAVRTSLCIKFSLVREPEGDSNIL